jgi:hypothetical protein
MRIQKSHKLYDGLYRRIIFVNTIPRSVLSTFGDDTVDPTKMMVGLTGHLDFQRRRVM